MKSFLRLFGLLILVALICVLTPLIRAGIECGFIGSDNTEDIAPQSPRNPQLITDLPNYLRREDQTYLTVPEWYIVYSADEYAAFVQNNPPSQFPYFRAIGQFWDSYYDVCRLTRDRYAFNSRYQTILAVIGVSFTLEYGVKGLYEKTIGWLTEQLSTDALTEEDAYAAEVATAYGNFIHTIPWFEFPYRETFDGLWRDTDLWGPNPIRKWERKLSLSAEYGVKFIYGWLIRTGNESSFDAQDLEIHVWADRRPEQAIQEETAVQIVKLIDDNAAILKMPRYEAFTKTLPKLAAQNMQFLEIAGNDEIVISAIAPRDWSFNLPDSDFLFVMPILTQPEAERIIIRVPVTSLHQVLNSLEDRGIQLEHIYDY